MKHLRQCSLRLKFHNILFIGVYLYLCNYDSILEASMIPGSTAEKGERDKHLKNDGPSNERGWSCIPLVVEVYGEWGQEAISMFAHFSKLLSLRQRQSRSAALNELYCHLSVVLMRQNAQVLLAHAAGTR